MIEKRAVFEGERKWAEAESVYRKVLPLWRKQGAGGEKAAMYSLRKLGSTLEVEHKWPEAESIFREALAVSSKKREQDPEALADLQKLVRLLANENKFSEAKDLLDKALTPAFAAQAASAELLAQRVTLLGRRGRWQEAADAATVSLENQPTDHYRAHMLAGLLVVTQKRSDYEKLCNQLITRFSNTLNPYIAERVAQDCLVLPNSGVDLALVDKMADTAVTRGGGEAALPYFEAAKAMSNYRLGRFNEAIEWAEKAVKSPTAEAAAKAKAFAVQAMANWQLGQKSVARAALASGDQAAPRFSPEQDSKDLGESWIAWLFARISLDEATTLMQSEASPSK